MPASRIDIFSFGRTKFIVKYFSDFNFVTEIIFDNWNWANIFWTTFYEQNLESQQDWIVWHFICVNLLTFGDLWPTICNWTCMYDRHITWWRVVCSKDDKQYLWQSNVYDIGCVLKSVRPLYCNLRDAELNEMNHQYKLMLLLKLRQLKV